MVDIASGDTAIAASEVKKKQKIYWDEVTENAVKEYLSLDFNHLTNKLEVYLKAQRELENYDPTIDDGYIADLMSKIERSGSQRNQMKKEAIFKARIEKSLHKLIENIIFSFKLFRYDIDVKTLHNDCMSHVYEKFHKFNPDQNTKSFSYFGTIAKHYLQNRKKELDTLKTINLNYDNHTEEVDERENYELHGHDDNDEMIELFHHMVLVFEKNMNNKALNDNDRKVLDSILDLFKSHCDSQSKDEYANIAIDVLDDDKYNKGSILDFILDRSKLTKDEMSKSLTKLRNLYKEKKKDFYNNNPGPQP